MVVEAQYTEASQASVEGMLAASAGVSGEAPSIEYRATNWPQRDSQQSCRWGRGEEGGGMPWSLGATPQRPSRLHSGPSRTLSTPRPSPRSPAPAPPSTRRSRTC